MSVDKPPCAGAGACMKCGRCSCDLSVSSTLSSHTLLLGVGQQWQCIVCFWVNLANIKDHFLWVDSKVYPWPWPCRIIVGQPLHYNTYRTVIINWSGKLRFCRCNGMLQHAGAQIWFRGGELKSRLETPRHGRSIIQAPVSRISLLPVTRAVNIMLVDKYHHRQVL